jgi:NitT/TauT family transport system substrate-binding protein
MVACGGAATTPSSTATNEPATVNIGQSIITLSNAGLYYAVTKGYFKEVNLTVNITTLQTGGTTVQAIASGSIDMAAAGSFDVATAADKGVKLQAIGAASGVTTEMCGSKKFAQAHNLTSSSTVEQVMSSFKGGTIGITGANSAPDLILRYLLSHYGNVKPDTDVKIVALGSVPAEITAIQRNQIDGFLQSPPGCEQATATGAAMPLFRPATVPALRDMPLGVLYTSPTWINTHKDIAGRMASALAKGDNFVRNPANTDATLAVLQTYFPTLDPATLRDAYTNVAQPTIPKDAKFTAAGWKAVSDLLLASGSISKAADTKEGTLWTNSYIKTS